MRLAKLNYCVALLLWFGSANAFDVQNDQGGKSTYTNITNTGNWLVVMLWAHDCIPCERQKPMLSSFAVKNKGSGIGVIGMSTDDAVNYEKAKAVMTRSRTKFSNFLYRGSNFSNDYRNITGSSFIGTPTYLVYNPSGQLSGMHVGPIKKAELTKHFKNKVAEKPVAITTDVFR